ncbi:MAG: hypothetical protein HY328_10225 [Chloroflexi bacterium]|nr:hypothetical protein [Chloroflexota bacterium]
MNDVMTIAASSRLNEVLRIAQVFSTSERVLLAKLLLDSVIHEQEQDEADWQQMGLAFFEKDWDNPDDAIYDNWRELYEVQAG